MFINLLLAGNTFTSCINECSCCC